MNRRDAALLLAKRFQGGVAGAALLLGKKEDTLRKELTGVNGYKWGADDEETLTQQAIAANVRDPLQALSTYARNCGALLVPLPQTLPEDGNTWRSLAEIGREFAEFAASVAEAESDSLVTPNELKRAEQEFADVVARGQALLAAMAAQVPQRNESAVLDPGCERHSA